MENKVFINDDDVIEIQVVGDQTHQSVEAMGKTLETLVGNFKRLSKPVLVLDDLRQMGKVTVEGRNTVVRLGKVLPYDKLAFLGKPGILSFGANLMLQAIGKGAKLKYFTDQQAATRWLLQ